MKWKRLKKGAKMDAKLDQLIRVVAQARTELASKMLMLAGVRMQLEADASEALYESVAEPIEAAIEDLEAAIGSLNIAITLLGGRS